jgi:hypothetical protein
MRHAGRRCGKPNCVCAQPDHPGHGPRYLWTAPWRAAAPRGGSSRPAGGQGARRVGQLPAIRGGERADGQRGDLRGAPTEPGRVGAPGRDDGTLRAGRGGVRRRGRTAGVGRGRDAGDLGCRPDGGGRARTREVELACLFTQTRLDDHGRPMRDPDSTSYVDSFAPTEQFATLVAAEARRRGADDIRRLVVLGDGAPWIWNLATAILPEATPIVDVSYASVRAWTGPSGGPGETTGRTAEKSLRSSRWRRLRPVREVT